MRTKTIDVPDWAHPLLLNCPVEGNSLRITQQLDRPQYVGLNKVLEALGGKWNKKLKAHVFPEDPRQLIANALGDGSVKVDVIPDKKQTWGQFFTPMFLVERMVDMAEIESGHRVIEPSAGTGRILQLLDGIEGIQVAAVEIDPEFAANLKENFPRVNVTCADFLECGFTLPYDRIMMNPPFSMGADIKHILHARSFLAPGGTLVAICAGGSKQAEQLQPIADLWEELPEDTFQESGTGVRSVLLVIEN
jgi:protein-L-isoaspartate O-methyltransferase